MKISKITNAFFSPTDSSRTFASMISAQFPLDTQELDLTPYAAHSIKRDFAPDELVIFSAPVYGGRIPVPAAERFRQLHGSHTPAILLVSYGNRDYDDALLELHDLVKENGFIPAAAAALIAEHNIMHSVGAGRPDAKDCEKIRLFAKNTWQKLSLAESTDCFVPLCIKGNRPYKTFGGFPMKPAADENCIECGLCAELCPVNAILPDTPGKTLEERCISCMRCIKICPKHARSLNRELLAEKEKGFFARCSTRCEPDFIL